MSLERLIILTLCPPLKHDNTIEISSFSKIYKLPPHASFQSMGFPFCTKCDFPVCVLTQVIVSQTNNLTLQPLFFRAMTYFALIWSFYTYSLRQFDLNTLKGKGVFTKQQATENSESELFKTKSFAQLQYG